MRSTITGGSAALLAIALATAAPAQTTGSDPAASGTTAAPATEAPAAGTDSTGAAPAAGEPAAAGTAETAAEPAAPSDTATGTATAEPEPADQAGPGYAMGDIVLGDADAPLTVIEYASFTCPHCATFHAQTFPEFKAQYVDTGKVKFILREVYFDQYGLWASMVARCGGEKGFYPLADTFLETQATWTRAPDIGHAIHQVGRRAGLSAARLEQCLSDRDFAKSLLATYQENAAADEVKSTPTFIIEGESHTGAMSFEEFSALLDAAL